MEELMYKSKQLREEQALLEIDFNLLFNKKEQEIISLKMQLFDYVELSHKQSKYIEACERTEHRLRQQIAALQRLDNVV